MAVLAGKGGNKGRAPKYNGAPATVGMYTFKHEHPQQPLSGHEIPLKPRYNGWKGW